jgi:serine/threonine protein kinase/TolB-like protein
MNTLGDWPRVKRVLEGALACEGADQQAFLANACGTDAALRARVETLLAASGRVGTFLETPAALLLDAGREDLSGRSVDSYQLASRLGAGGMGEIYLAHDTKLDRPVALKFLAPELAADRTRLRRFHQEARAASSLNHPHIIVVHDFGELDGRPYLVTEFIEGETLRRRLRRGRLPIRDVVDIGLQMAGALAAAHARGLVHRDIKPENVMVRRDGYVKVLDFGLAKLATVTQSSDHGGVESHTQSGMVMGTPRYMSPEQARGLDLDARSDVWSLGIVLYEMATGGLPFADNRTATLFDVDRSVKLTVAERAARDLPPELLRVICKALETVRDRRYPSAAELCADLKHVQRETESVRSGGVIGIVQRRLARVASFGPRKLALAAMLAAAVGALVSIPLMRGNRVAGPTGVQKTVAVLPFDNVSGDGGIDYLRLALADEVATALSSTPSLAVRPMASSRRFAGGEGSPQEAGRQLRVGRIVIGHFSMHQSELRVTVEVVEVDTNHVVWRDTIAVEAADSIALRDGLTSRIRDGLLPALGAGARTASHGRPRNAYAYAGYLKSLAISSDPEPNREAIAMLERASTIDPDHADTWASLGRRYYDEGQYGGGGNDAFRQSEAALRQALALDPDHISAAVELLVLQIDAGRLQDGYEIARRLVARRPDSGEAHFALGNVLRYGGLLEDSARECDEAISRDPANPAFRTCSATFIQLGRYDRALDFVRLDSGSEWARLVTRWVYQRLGRRDDALEQHRQQSRGYPHGMVPASFHGFIARCLSGAVPAAAGPLSDDEVRAFLTLRDSEPLYFFAGDLAYCGDPAAAVRLLRESIPRNYCASSAIEGDPTFAAIRNRTEYGELLGAARACRTRFRDHVRAKMRTP